ncbi:MAG TPA: 2'-5' RNA ligase family protein [Candidatus Limnocylindrales bacterium]|nr:2'-5' RNA ligase family protein [Candidatus Limnocylindrales bacterium]
MTLPGKSNVKGSQGGEQSLPFYCVRRLTNHWARPLRGGSYYWFLTFEHQPQLQALVRRCQRAISFPYYDLTPPADLHMTLERIAFEEEISPQQLDEVAKAGEKTCETIRPLEFAVEHLGGTSGAVGFNAYPREPIHDLRDRLRAATASAYPAARFRTGEFDPHITIAYCNAEVPAAQAVATVKALNGSVSVKLAVVNVSLVLLTRLPRAYRWQSVSRLPLLGMECNANTPEP